MASNKVESIREAILEYLRPHFWITFPLDAEEIGVLYDEHCKTALKELCLEGIVAEEDILEDIPFYRYTRNNHIDFGLNIPWILNFPVQYYHIVRKIQESGFPDEVVEIIQLKDDVKDKKKLAQANQICIDKLTEKYPSNDYIVQLRAKVRKIEGLRELIGYLPEHLKKGRIKASTCLQEWNVEYETVKCKKSQPIERNTIGEVEEPIMDAIIKYQEYWDHGYLFNKYSDPADEASILAHEGAGWEAQKAAVKNAFFSPGNIIFKFMKDLYFITDEELHSELVGNHGFPEETAQGFIRDTGVSRAYDRLLSKPGIGVGVILFDMFFGKRIYNWVEKRYNKRHQMI